MHLFAQKHINKYYYINEIIFLCQLLFKESTKRLFIEAKPYLCSYACYIRIDPGKQTEEQRFRLILKTYGKSEP